VYAKEMCKSNEMMNGRFYGMMFEKGNAFSVDADEKEGYVPSPITHRQEDTVARHIYILMSVEEYFDIIQKAKLVVVYQVLVLAPHNTPILCTSSHIEARFIGEMSTNDSKHLIGLRKYFPMTLNTRKYSTYPY
jgi:hypothetical protein